MLLFLLLGTKKTGSSIFCESNEPYLRFLANNDTSDKLTGYEKNLSRRKYKQ